MNTDHSPPSSRQKTNGVSDKRQIKIGIRRNITSLVLAFGSPLSAIPELFPETSVIFPISGSHIGQFGVLAIFAVFLGEIFHFRGTEQPDEDS